MHITFPVSSSLMVFLVLHSFETVLNVMRSHLHTIPVTGKTVRDIREIALLLGARLRY